ncbi:MAG: glycine cleavage system protein R [Zoogloeaceae bacterium]|nr:glycine cleavage system protein R [Zoogloeaceae bacterium]
MHTPLILTVIGDDRPGLVETLSRLITAHRGNWLESSMAQLAGKFAGIVKIDVPAEELEPLCRDLEGQSALRVVAQPATPEVDRRAGSRLKLSLVGQDRLGIVREVTTVLARHGVNIEELATRTESAPMSGETLFHATATLLAAPGLEPRALQDDLERISHELMVEIALSDHP